MRVHKSLRPNESDGGREFKLFDTECESMIVNESLRPNDSAWPELQEAERNSSRSPSPHLKYAYHIYLEKRHIKNSTPIRTVVLFGIKNVIPNTSFLLPAGRRQKDIRNGVLRNVDSEGSTLLHLAVDSGSPAVSTLGSSLSFRSDGILEREEHMSASERHLSRGFPLSRVLL